jgi:hypothetical protein
VYQRLWLIKKGAHGRNFYLRNQKILPVLPKGGENMRNIEKSFEELEELEQKLYDEEEATGYPNYSAKINVYKEMHKLLSKLVRGKKENYRVYLENIEQNLVHQLIHYGTYLKTEYQKDDHLAAKCLKEALNYDRRNPIAAFRLGFLAYKQWNYSEALHFFEKALEFQTYNQKHPYQLNNQQQLHAHLYLTTSALYIANETTAKMNKLSLSKNLEIPESEFSMLNITLIENILGKYAFYNISKNDKITCSKEDCEKLTENPPPETVILYFSDRMISVFYKDTKPVDLSIEQGEMLKHFMLKSSEKYPATRGAFSYNQTLIPNTYTKNVARLRNKLQDKGFPPIIHTKRYHEETAYYFDHAYSYHVLYRVDEEIEY